RTDIYSLGAVTYEMLTGDPPFSGSTVQAIVAKVLTERPTAPTAVRDTVPPAVERAVLAALAKLPADRFASAEKFAEALTRTEVPYESGVRAGATTGEVATPRRSRMIELAVLAGAVIVTAAV